MSDLIYEIYSNINKLLESEVKEEDVVTKGIEDFSNTREKVKLKKEDSDELSDVNDEEAEKERYPTPDGSPTTIDLGNAAKVESIIKLINSIRASHSFEDEEVLNRIKYFHNNKLSAEEKRVLYIFLVSISFIGDANLDIDVENIYSPRDFNFVIQKTGNNSMEKIKSMKNRKDSEEHSKKRKIQPIVVGK